MASPGVSVGLTDKVSVVVHSAPSHDVFTRLTGRWPPGWWVVPLTVSMVIIFAVSGWSLVRPTSERMAGELLLVAINTLPLLAIRRNPLLVVAALSIAYPIWLELGYPSHELQSLPTVAAMFALGAWDRPLWLRSLGLTMPVWLVVGGTISPWDAELLELTFIAVFFVVVWTLGVLIAERRLRTLALEARTRELEEARRELADRAVAEERSRIARELHDVVAHAMSVITVQAGVGAHVADRSDPTFEALSVIERTGREALEEMRRMLTVLRDSDQTDSARAPQPTLDDLPTLLEQVRQAGIRIVFTTRGARRDLSPGLELTVYRICQEALTNVVKHAPEGVAEVTVSYEEAILEVEVLNGLSTSGSSQLSDEVGMGLRGMAERVALYGGDLEVTTDGNHFRVDARFPLEETDEGR